MSQNNLPAAQQPQSPALLTAKMIEEAPSTKALLDIPALQNSWANTYNKVSGRNDGAMRFEAEKVLFMQLVTGNKAFEKVTKFSLYTAFVQLAISGLTLRDGIAYVIPYGDKAEFVPGWQGRLEQINEMRNVRHTNAPQVVYDCDEFEMELGERVRIIKHKPGKRTPESIITNVYMVITFTEGREVFFMTREDVLNIRDRYSDTYKSYAEACAVHKKPIGSTFRAQVPGKTWESTFKPPMWLTDEAQAFKKTLVKRVYKTLPKMPKQKWLDDQIAGRTETIEQDGEDLNRFLNETVIKDAGNPAHAGRNSTDDFDDVAGADARNDGSGIYPGDANSGSGSADTGGAERVAGSGETGKPSTEGFDLDDEEKGF